MWGGGGVDFGGGVVWWGGVMGGVAGRFYDLPYCRYLLVRPWYHFNGMFSRS